MKHIAIAAGLLAANLCWSLQGQILTLSANIPFPFRVGDIAMPAGQYTIENSHGFLLVREEGGKHVAPAFFVRRETRGESPQTGVLEFNRYGSNYFLAQIWAPGERQGISLPPSSSEKELAHEVGLLQRATIILQHK